MAAAKKPAAGRRKPAARRRIGAVEKATRADLAAIRVEAPALADSGLAATAVAMAREIDGDNSATSKSMCAARLTDILAELRALQPPMRKADTIDQLADARKKRRAAAAGSAAAADLPRT